VLTMESGGGFIAIIAILIFSNSGCGVGKWKEKNLSKGAKA